VTVRLPAALAFASLGLVLGGAAFATPPLTLAPPASAHGLAIAIVAPDQTVTASAAVGNAPPPAKAPATPFAYPDDGSVVSAGSTFVTVSASAPDGTAAVVSEVTNLSLFGGEITADDVRGSVSSAGTIGDLADSTVTNLVVLGQSVTGPAPNTSLPLEDWGDAVVLGQSTKQGSAASPSWRGTVTALAVHLKLDHGGLPAGTDIRIGFADAYSRSPAPVPAAKRKGTPARKLPPQRLTRAKPAPVLSGAAKGIRPSDVPRTRRPSPLPLFVPPPSVTPELTAGRYVFPVYGPSAYGDTFGVLRPDVSGGWHHGDDIFAPLGAPLLAVADGTVFSVGWNHVGGYRLWLRDGGGNEFYYAHLSAFTSLAVNGRRVKAGDVLGFVGNSGDAEGTPFHLHFEVHPVALLFLGYDGAVDPTKYLDAWKRLEDVRILAAVPFNGPAAAVSSAPPPGAILLESSDISTANGLDPGSLRRAMNAPATLDVTRPRVTELPVPLPVLDRA
jgi:murein DD-endopeptidase MepM/ murein hydrolase activator NlpD